MKGCGKMSKIYAVRKGRKTGIFDTWTECEENIKGYSGAEYKSFLDYHEAAEYIEKFERINKDNNESMKVYVDGSYSDKLKATGFGCVFIENNVVIHTISRKTTINPSENLWNVSAEIAGVLAAVEWGVNNNIQELSIYYDYEGLQKWFDGAWKSNKETTSNYVEKMQEYSTKIKLNFVKVKAHSGDKYNDMADQLAKDALISQVEAQPVSRENYISLSLSECQDIVGTVNQEKVLVELGNLAINDRILKKFAKNIWRKENRMVKDINDIYIRFDVQRLIMNIRITSFKYNEYNINIKLESV